MKKIQDQITFVGLPFSDQLIDEQKSFQTCNLQMEQDPQFQAFLADNQLTDQRSSMVVFGPENFMYWYGVLAAAEVKVPSGLMKFVLPKAEVALEELPDQNLAYFSQPLNLIIPKFLAQVAQAGIQTYENPGDSMTPYFVQDLNLSTKKLTRFLYLEVSD